jgi:hypothetical protein
MATFKITVTDRMGKYPSRTYEIEAEQEFLAYGPATERFIKDNNHRARGPAERLSSYYSRFWNAPAK